MFFGANGDILEMINFWGNTMKEIIYILEIIGTVAFSVSGALVAIGASLDIFGVVFVGCITAVGGGIVRDLLIGNILTLTYFIKVKQMQCLLVVKQQHLNL